MDRNGRPASPPYEYGGRRPERRDRVRRVELLIEPGQSLGLMIRGGVEYGLGIFVTGVDKDSVADRAGLMVIKLCHDLGHSVVLTAYVLFQGWRSNLRSERPIFFRSDPRRSGQPIQVPQTNVAAGA
jgi:hypothetical protein